MVVMKVEIVVMEVALMVVMEVAMKVVVKMVVIWCARCRLRMVERDALNTLIRAHLLRGPRTLHFKVHACHKIYTSTSTMHCARHEIFTSRSTSTAPPTKSAQQDSHYAPDSQQERCQSAASTSSNF